MTTEPQRHRRAFTLIELLVCITIISVLATLGFAGYQGAMNGVRRSKEITAAKTLITAYLSYASDHDGECMPGTNRYATDVYGPGGIKAISYPVSERYAFRLAPYFSYQINGVLLVNKSVEQLEKMFNPASGGYAYGVSVYTSMGMNIEYVGGTVTLDPHTGGTTIANEAEVLTRLSRATTPLLVFASAGVQNGNDVQEGFLRVASPRYWTGVWNDDSSPQTTGYVHARHGNKAVCSMTDGSVQMLTRKELNDMRLWSPVAARDNNPDYGM